MNFTKTASQASKLTATSAKNMAETLTDLWGAENIKFTIAPCPEFGKFAIAYIKNDHLAGWYKG